MRFGVHFYLTTSGYHVLDLNNLKDPNYYPKELPDYPGVNTNNLEIDDVITIRVFFKVGKGKDFRVDSGLIDLRVEFREEGKVFAIIITQLPKEFSGKDK